MYENYSFGFVLKKLQPFDYSVNLQCYDTLTIRCLMSSQYLVCYNIFVCRSITGIITQNVEKYSSTKEQLSRYNSFEMPGCQKLEEVSFCLGVSIILLHWLSRVPYSVTRSHCHRHKIHGCFACRPMRNKVCNLLGQSDWQTMPN